MRSMKHVSRKTKAFALCVSLLLPSLARAEYPTEYSRLKQESCRRYNAEFQRDAIEAKDDPQWPHFEDRLALIDRVTLLIVADCETYKADQLRRQTGVSLGSGTLARRSPVGALKLVDRYRSDFSSALPLPSLSQDERSFLTTYYQACLNARMQYVFLHGQAVAAADPLDTRHILELCMVLPFLRVNDSDWNSAQIDPLPAWIKPPANLRAIEAFAISAHRLHTAFQINLCTKTTGSRAGAPCHFATYLNSAADLAIARGDDNAAVYVLRAAIADAKTSGLNDVIPALVSRLAQVLAATGDATAAATELKTAMDDPATQSKCGPLAALRLKYLYDSAQFSTLLSEAPIYKADSRCESVLPQILYTAWAASRKVSADSGSDDVWSRAFLNQFPDHPLGAEIFFSAGTQALASDHRDEAIKLFHYLINHYPQSALVGKTLDIEHRLTSTDR